MKVGFIQPVFRIGFVLGLKDECERLSFNESIKFSKYFEGNSSPGYQIYNKDLIEFYKKKILPFLYTLNFQKNQQFGILKFL